MFCFGLCIRMLTRALQADFRVEFDHAVPLQETIWTEFAAIARVIRSRLRLPVTVLIR